MWCRWIWCRWCRWCRWCKGSRRCLDENKQMNLAAVQLFGKKHSQELSGKMSLCHWSSQLAPDLRRNGCSSSLWQFVFFQDSGRKPKNVKKLSESMKQLAALNKWQTSHIIKIIKANQTCPGIKPCHTVNTCCLQVVWSYLSLKT